MGETEKNTIRKEQNNKPTGDQWVRTYRASPSTPRLQKHYSSQQTLTADLKRNEISGRGGGICLGRSNSGIVGSNPTLCCSRVAVGRGPTAGLENRDYGRRGSAALTMRHPFIRKSWHQLRRQAAVARSV
jgi:hypothetical protein